MAVISPSLSVSMAAMAASEARGHEQVLQVLVAAVDEE